MHGLPRRFAPKAWRLLRVLLVRLRKMPADAAGGLEALARQGRPGDSAQLRNSHSPLPRRQATPLMDASPPRAPLPLPFPLPSCSLPPDIATVVNSRQGFLWSPKLRVGVRT